MSNMYVNMVNYNKYILSTLDIRYIGYFYYVFPLHLNSFKRLFYHKLSKHIVILRSHIDFLRSYLTCIKDIKFKLDCSTSDTIKFLDSLNNHLNIYKKPHDNLKSIIESYVKILIDAITSDSDKICQLKECIQEVKSKLCSLKEYLHGIITKFSKLNHMTINSRDTYHRGFFMNMYRVFKDKLKKFSSKITPLCETLEQTITLLSNPIEIDLYDPDTLKRKLENNQNYLDSTFKSILEELKIFPSLENIPYIQNVKNKLEKVKCMIPELKSSLSTKKEILLKFYQYYVEQMVPTKTDDNNVATYSSSISTKTHILKANQERLEELQIKCEGDLQSLKTFITSYTKHIQDFDDKLTEPCGCIDAAIAKVDQTKSDINKKKLIKYIISLIDTINFIISVEPSEIVQYLKPIIGIKPGLQSIKSSIKTTDIENDIQKLQSLYEDIIDTNSFSNNMTKLKEYIASVESHLGGIDTILKSLKNIKNLIDSKYLKLISSDLVLDYWTISQHKSEPFDNGPFKNYVDELKRYIEELKQKIDIFLGFIESLMCIVMELKKQVEYTNSQIKCLKSDIIKMECAIEGVARNFIQCTLQSTNTIYSRIGSLGVLEVDKQVLSMYSLSNVIDYKVLVNRLLETANKIHKVFEFIYSSYGCFCIGSFESKTAGKPDIYLGIEKHVFKYLSTEEIYKMKNIDQIKNLYGLDTQGNHMCMCMVIKYVMYPAIIDISYLISYELQTLSTLSRKYEKYGPPPTVGSDLIKILVMVIEIVDSISRWVRNNYCIFWTGYTTRVEFRCYCTYNDDKNYHVILNIVLVLSSLLSNIWSIDHESFAIGIECLSTLIRDFDKIDTQNNKSTDSNSNSVFNDIINILFCPLKFCILSSKLEFVSNFVNFISNIPFLSTFIERHISNISLFNVLHFENVINQMKQYNNTNNNGPKEYLQVALNNYNSINSEKNICGQFKNQCCVLSSNIVIILSTLISVKLWSKLYSKTCSDFKERLTKFLELVCKCDNKECCLKQLLDKKEQICNGRNGCDELLKNCVESCCSNNCCSGSCPCSKLKDSCGKLKELCCDNTQQNGLCQVIKRIVECGCNTEKSEDESCKKCICCKLVVESILILQNMFRHSVWIISKNIIVSCKYLLEIMDKIKKTRNADLFMNSVIKRIIEINSRYNRKGITLVKNNLLTSSANVSINATNVTSVRNWGYDTHYEHQPTSNNIVTDNCLNLLDALNNNENTLRKLHHFSSLLGSSVDRNFSLVSCSCLEISS